MNTPITGLPGIGTSRTATPVDILAGNEQFAQYIPAGRTIDKDKAADPGNTNDAGVSLPTTLRPGLLLGKVTSGGKYANSIIGLSGGALTSTGTTLTSTAAIATELSRRIGSTGTFKLTGPATAAGTVRTRTVTYSALNTGTGDITITAIGANEVQTVAVDTILSGGKIDITAIDYLGVPQSVNVAYNTSWTQTVADIQTALNALLGTSAVACAVTNTHDMTITFSGTNYAAVDQPPVVVDISGATGPTKVTVTTTTNAADGRFIAGSLIQPTDGSETILTILGEKYPWKITDIDGTRVDTTTGRLLASGHVKTSSIVNYPVDASLKNYVKAALKGAGNFSFDDSY